MKAYGITRTELEAIATDLGITLIEVGDVSGTKRDPRPGTSFMLRPLTDTYRKFSRDGRRIWAVTWQGHYDFMDRLFFAAPDAKLTSTLATYNGREDFHAKARATWSEWVA